LNAFGQAMLTTSALAVFANSVTQTYDHDAGLIRPGWSGRHPRSGAARFEGFEDFD